MIRVTRPMRPGPEATCVPTRGAYPVPPRFQVPNSEGQLRAELRVPFTTYNNEVTRDPVSLLARAAEAFLSGDEAMGNALADLSVTGRRIYQAFRASPPQDDEVRARVSATAAQSEVDVAIASAVDRAYEVAWLLEGIGDRDAYEWIAVSGEDDSPRRPVNDKVSTPFPQHEIDVDVQATRSSLARTVRSRFIVTRPEAERTEEEDLPAGAIAGRQLPPEPALRIGADERLLLFLHGHGSRLEECLDLAPKVAEFGFTLVAMDLPSRGYAEMIEPWTDPRDLGFDWESAAAAGTGLAVGGVVLGVVGYLVGGPLGAIVGSVIGGVVGGSVAGVELTYAKSAPQMFPLLEFTEQFVVDFVSALEADLGGEVRNQIVGVIGGSLGGNLTLRLAERDDAESLPFLSHIISWSPASSWTALLGFPRGVGPYKQYEAMMEQGPETLASRQAFFHGNFEQWIPGSAPPAQQWYRPSWPCGGPAVAHGRASLQEIFCTAYRRWHAGLAFEQMAFSHFSAERASRIRSRTLLVVGSEDNFNYTGIFQATRSLARLMSAARGVCVSLSDTGHSLHAERPEQLAREIRDFYELSVRRVAEEYLDLMPPLSLLEDMFQTTPAAGASLSLRERLLEIRYPT